MVVEKVYKRHVKDMSEQRERIVAAWNELDQRIVDTAVSHCGALVIVLGSKLWVDISNTNCDLMHQISCTYIIVKYRDITRTLYLTIDSQLVGAGFFGSRCMSDHTLFRRKLNKLGFTTHSSNQIATNIQGWIQNKC